MVFKRRNCSTARHDARHPEAVVVTQPIQSAACQSLSFRKPSPHGDHHLTRTLAHLRLARALQPARLGRSVLFHQRPGGISWLTRVDRVRRPSTSRRVSRRFSGVARAYPCCCASPTFSRLDSRRSTVNLSKRSSSTVMGMSIVAFIRSRSIRIASSSSAWWTMAGPTISASRWARNPSSWMRSRFFAKKVC